MSASSTIIKASDLLHNPYPGEILLHEILEPPMFRRTLTGEAAHQCEIALNSAPENNTTQVPNR